jgi:2,5-diketo-D-gluconate reductase A
MDKVPRIKLNSGHEIPQLGFGTYQIPPMGTVEAVKTALDASYRHIDTAEMYGNEKEVGIAIKESQVGRAEVFITSKLNNTFHEPDVARRAFDDTLTALDTSFIDLFLIHWPLPSLYGGDYVQTWKTLEEFHKDARAHSVGVSNFQVPHLERILDEGEIVPAVNQVEVHPYFQNREVVQFSRKHGIVIESWSPIAQGAVLGDPTIVAIAKDLHKTPAQVVLRWHTQHKYVVFPKSVTPARIRENFEIFDFKLHDAQMDAIDGLDQGEAGRTGPNPDKFAYLPR